MALLCRVVPTSRVQFSFLFLSFFSFLFDIFFLLRSSHHSCFLALLSPSKAACCVLAFRHPLVRFDWRKSTFLDCQYLALSPFKHRFRSHTSTDSLHLSIHIHQQTQRNLVSRFSYSEDKSKWPKTTNIPKFCGLLWKQIRYSIPTTEFSFRQEDGYYRK